MYPFYGFYPNYSFLPFIPIQNLEPPKLWDLMQSMVNYDKTDKVKNKDLSLEARKTIFDFDYPLSSNVSRETFEKNILNHFIMRRIGYETFTTWQIMLETKLNEIMPIYNKMFDALENWDLFNDGTKITIQSSDDRDISHTKTGSNNNTGSFNSESTTTDNGSNTTKSEHTEDLKNSDMPQNNLSNIQSGEYVTDYEYNTINDDQTNTNQNQRNITQNGSYTDTSNSNETNKTDDTNTHIETRSRSPEDKIYLMKEMQNNISNIYTMIYKDLEPLFYQVIY